MRNTLPEIKMITSEVQLAACLEGLKSEEMIAVDCEGHGLCRNGTLDILSIATRSGPVFCVQVVDVKVLQEKAFESALKETY